MIKILACFAVLAFAMPTAFGQAPAIVLNDDDGNPFRFLPAVGDAPEVALNDDDGNPIVLLPVDMSTAELADRANTPSHTR